MDINAEQQTYRVTISDEKGDVIWSHDLPQTPEQFDAWVQYQREWFEEH
jgi:hypothetical protein